MRTTGLLVLLVATITLPAYSSGCPFLGADATKWEQAAHFAKVYDLIFEGQLEAIHNPLDDTSSGSGAKSYRFRILRSYKGPAAGSIDLLESQQLRLGAIYLVLTGGWVPCPLYLEPKGAETQLRFLRGEQPTPEDLRTLGDELVRMIRPRGRRICGRMHDFPTEPLGESLFRLWHKEDDGWDWDPFDSSNVQVDATGDYCIPGVDPGRYVLTVTLYDQGKTRRFVGSTGGVEQLSEAQTFLVQPQAETTIPDIALRAEPMFTLRGRVVLSDGRLPKINKGSGLVRLDANDGSLFDIAPAAGFSEDGVFEIQAIRPGRYILRGWYSASDYAEDGNTLLWEEEAEGQVPVNISANMEGLTVVLILRKPK